MKKLIMLFFAVLLLFGCYSESFIVINESKSQILENLSYTDDPENYWHPYVTKYIYNDTMILKFDHDNQPLEIMYIFQNDSCYYQQINVYCSPCAERFVRKIKKDKRYKFKDLDGINLLSTTTNPPVIVRLGNSTKNENICTDIKAIRLSN